jgi:hypothetical protein
LAHNFFEKRLEGGQFLVFPPLLKIRASRIYFAKNRGFVFCVGENAGARWK